MDWSTIAASAEQRADEGEKRVPKSGDARQKQLVRIANASYAAGLAHLMEENGVSARDRLLQAAECYRQSFEFAPPESWGRPIGAMKARLIAGDENGAEDDARWSLELGSPQSESAIGKYAAVLAYLILGEDASAGRLAADLRSEPPNVFPGEVARALYSLGIGDGAQYRDALTAVLTSFEKRESYLEGVPVADTVIALEALASERFIAVTPVSALLPPA